MTATIAVIAPGMMGAAIGARLVKNGAKVLTLLDGRSEDTKARAAQAGIAGASVSEIAKADMILSVLPPGDALALAQMLAPVLSASAHKPHYADLNAVNPDTAVEIGEVIAATGCRYIDGGIIGGPPRDGYSGPVIYVSGPDASTARLLGELGLNCHELDAIVGTASALKMCYGGITKGVTAIGTTLALAAARAGIAEALRDELKSSQPALFASLQRSVPDMFGKAYRWVAEMEEISTFVGDRAEGVVHKGIAGLYDRLAQDYEDQQKEIKALAQFFRKD
ncbi:MAG: DUF1932 domain-containing protein [Beijerinckiaceae bacterium]